MKQTNKSKDSIFMRALKGNLWSKQTNIFVSIGLGLVILGIGYVITSSYAAQPGSTLNGPLVSAYPSKCLDNNANLQKDGNKVQLWDCNDTTAQNWLFRSDGTVRLNNSSFCLDIIAGTKVAQLMSCNGSSSQVWKATDDHTVINQSNGLCLEDENGNTANGNVVKLANCNGSDPQKWYFNTPLDSAFPGKCIDNNSKNMVAGNKIQLWDCNNSIAQKWTFKHGGLIHVYGSNLCIATKDGKTTQMTPIVLGSCDAGSPSQVWQFNADSHTIVNVQSGLCIDDRYSSTDNGNLIWLWQCNGTNAQKWYAPVATSVPVLPTPPTTPTPTPPTPTPTPPTTPTTPTTPGSSYNQAVLNDHPVGFWGLSNANGTEPDLTGGGHAGQYQGGATQNGTLPNGERAAVFNGSNQYLSIPSFSGLSIPTTKQLTWETWVRPDAINTGNGYTNWMGKCANFRPKCEWEVRMYQNGFAGRCNRITAYVFNPNDLPVNYGSGAYWQPGTCGGMQQGKWLHVVGQYWTNTQRGGCGGTVGGIDIWVNGVKWDFGAHSPTGCMSQYNITPRANDDPLTVGMVQTESFFKGGIGKLAVYNYLLSQAQINAHFTAMTGKQPAGNCGDRCSSPTYGY